MKYEEIATRWTAGENSPAMVQAAWDEGESRMAKNIATGATNFRAEWVTYSPLPTEAPKPQMARAVLNDGSGAITGTILVSRITGTSLGLVTEALPVEGDELNFFGRNFPVGILVSAES